MNLECRINVKGSEIELLSLSKIILKTTPVEFKIICKNDNVKNISIKTDVGRFYALRKSKNEYYIKLRKNMFNSQNTKIHIIAETEGYGDTLVDVESGIIDLSLTEKNLFDAKDDLQIIAEIISDITKRSINYGNKN